MGTTEGPASGASGMAKQQVPGLWSSELREGYAEIGDVRLHYIEAYDTDQLTADLRGLI